MKRVLAGSLVLVAFLLQGKSNTDSLRQEISRLKEKVAYLEEIQKENNSKYSARLLRLEERLGKTKQVQKVPAGSLTPWNQADIRITPGVWTISATGEWYSNPSHGMHSPAGSPVEPVAHGRYILPSAPEGALIGRIGTTGTPFLIGKKTQIELFACGELEQNGQTIDRTVSDNALYLTINDSPSGFYDNQGDAIVTLTRSDRSLKKSTHKKQPIRTTEIPSSKKVTFEPTEVIAYKPIIYCYPTDAIDISVKISFADSGKFSYTYPTYGKKGWDVTAFPDGKLIDRKGKSYYSLFWEGEVPVFPDDSTGFVVHRDSLNSFFERSLDSLGLNYKEKQEFIIFWSPLLMENEYTFIHFSRKNYALSAKMEIVPRPETLNRFLMLYRKADRNEKVTPQQLKNPGRKGFVVVEWGGVEMKIGGMCEIN